MFFAFDFLLFFYSIQQRKKRMGNVNDHNITNHQDLPKRSTTPIVIHKMLKSMGPRNLPFAKLSPKTMQLQEQDKMIEQATIKEKSHSKHLVDDEQDDQEDEDEEVIAEIKIKWNSFIKMKKKNYLDDYTVVKEIGRGGFGTVSKVIAKYTGVSRAAKKIKKSSLGKSQHQKLFAQMAIMITLDHPNIARLFQVYDYKSSYVLILELCQGGQVFKKIITKSLKQETAALIMAQLLQALHYLHSRGIVHRDLKPENMLFEKGTNCVKLIDFGIAVRHDGKEPLTARIGTPYYIAPEVLCKKYTQKCDLWSAGIILFMMISYRPPFNGDSQTQVMQNILKADPPLKTTFFKNISAQCIDLIKRLLVKNPALRPSASQAYQHPWIQKYIKMAKSCGYDGMIQNISTFKFSNKLEAVVFTFIVSQILTSQQKKVLKELFQQLDQNHDGVISCLQLKNALINRKQISEERVNFLVRIIDTNGSGQIDYTEFIVAALEPQQLTSNHFEQAFAYFDIDHSGVITFQQIASFLQDKKQSEDEIRKIFKDIDENHDGQISKQQFLKVLTDKSKERIAKMKKQKDKSQKSTKKLTRLETLKDVQKVQK